MRAPPAEVIGGERARRREHVCGSTPCDDAPAVLAGTRTQVEQPIGLLHDLRVVLHDQQ
jgi:hypothetical protein